MPTNIADEFGDIAKRMKSITDEEGRVEPNKTDQRYWCYQHGILRAYQTDYLPSYKYRMCMSGGSCSRPVIRYCDSCDCTGWTGHKECRECSNPFIIKNPNG